MAFEKMNNLKRLIIESGSFTTGPKHLPNSLRVLEWWDYPSPSLPIDFHPKKLVKLELLGSCLMSLDLFMSKNRYLTYVVSQIKLADVCNCESLIEIHESVRFLDKLKILYADGCSKLTSFPPIKLTSLEELKLSYCGSLECFPEILGKMENVTSLDIKNTPIKELPSSIQNLTQLQRIKLKNGGIIQLPSSIFGMKELRYFIVKKCEGLLLSKENEGEAQMTSMVFRNPIDFLDLSHSNISDEFLLRGLPLFANVKELHLRGDDFTILPACIKELQFLKEIYFKELHEADGYKLFRLPGPSIPEWFEHCINGSSISFWFRNKFPVISLSCVFAGLELYAGVWFTLIINGNKYLSPHIFLADLSSDLLCICDHIEELFYDLVLSENEWNHVVCTTSWVPQPIKQIGIHVLKQGSNMEDIQFTNPLLLKEKRDFHNLPTWGKKKRLVFVSSRNDF
ncbi:hypothetical protein JHK85_048624 [Glycine max]|nr:hypothetical protein JHK86_048014 [Glycine max]KAG4943978.1 hypothetical protein JHK85_048624 [Glycine max]